MNLNTDESNKSTGAPTRIQPLNKWPSMNDGKLDFYGPDGQQAQSTASRIHIMSNSWKTIRCRSLMYQCIIIFRTPKSMDRICSLLTGFFPMIQPRRSTIQSMHLTDTYSSSSTGFCPTSKRSSSQSFSPPCQWRKFLRHWSKYITYYWSPHLLGQGSAC